MTIGIGSSNGGPIPNRPPIRYDGVQPRARDRRRSPPCTAKRSKTSDASTRRTTAGEAVGPVQSTSRSKAEIVGVSSLCDAAVQIAGTRLCHRRRFFNSATQ